jgi:hypothetical protein
MCAAGKTHVICGILACLLHGNSFKRGDKDEGAPREPNGQGLRQHCIPQKRILVCAQSNSAIDELLGSLQISQCVSMYNKEFQYNSMIGYVI